MSILISGTNSGAGKTTLTMALLRLFSKMGLDAGGYKSGPDFIDPMFYKFACGNHGKNLDGFLMDEVTIKQIFSKNKRDIKIIEGAMGLYDGLLSDPSKASAAHIAKVTSSPVILVLNGAGISHSAAAMVLGYINYDPHVNIAGVIINNVGSLNHYEIIKNAVENRCGVKCLGYLPRCDDLVINSRHLGLIPAGEIADLNEKLNKAAELAETHLDISEILKIARQNECDFCNLPLNITPNGKRIAVAKDNAFCFNYTHMMEEIEESGWEIVTFSPLDDEKLPENIDFLYIGGGYPEIFADKLSDNKSMREDINAKLSDGLPAFAEAGGFAYLLEELVSLSGTKHKMCGFFKGKSELSKKLLNFGYCTVTDTYNTVNSFPAHSFHCYRTETVETPIYYARKAQKEWICGYKKQNVYASEVFSFNLINILNKSGKDGDDYDNI